MTVPELEKYPFKQRMIMLRMKQGWSQQAMSAETGFAASSIGTWELGENIPKPDKFQVLEEVFGVPVDVWARWRAEEIINRRKGKYNV